MNVLKSIEKRMEKTVEGVFGKAFKSSVQPVELAHKLAKEMGDHKSVSVSRVYVPNEFDVYLASPDYEQLHSFEATLVEELASYLIAFARRESWTLVAKPVIVLHADDDLGTGEFGIATRTVSRARDSRRRRVRRVAAPVAAVPPAAAVAARPVIARRCSSGAARAAAPAPRPPSARGVLRGSSGRPPAHGPVTVIGRSRRCEHRRRRPQRVAPPLRGPQAGRRLHAHGPRLHQRHPRQPA